MVWACGSCSANNNNSRTTCWRCDQDISHQEKAQPVSTKDTISVARLDKTSAVGTEEKVVSTENIPVAGTEKAMEAEKKAVGTENIPVAGPEKKEAVGDEKTRAASEKKQIAKIQPFSPGVDKNEIRIVLIGKTGVGKSSSANTILGQNILKARASPVAVTEKCHFERSERFGKRILLIDTPGFFDTSTAKDVIDNEIKKCIGISAPGPHAFLLVMSFTNRFTEEERKVLREVSDMFGEHMDKYLIVLFTGRDQMDDGSHIVDHVEKYPEEFRRLVQNAGGSYITFNNRGSHPEKEDDVKALLDRIDQMVKKNGGSHFTSKMFEAAEKIIQQRIGNELAVKKEEIRKSVEEEIRTAVETEMRAEFDAEKTRLKQIYEEDIKQYTILRRELDKERLKCTMETKDQDLSQSLRPVVISQLTTETEEKILRQREECEGPERAEVHRQLARAGQEIQQLLQRRRKMADDEEDDPVADVFQANANVAKEVYLEKIRDNERIDIEKGTGILRQMRKTMKGSMRSFLDLFR